MLGLGLASTHVGMTETPESWSAGFERRLARWPELKDSLPLQLKVETDEVMEGYRERVAAAFKVLREQVEAYRPDAIIMVGDDQHEIFDHSNVPALAIVTAEELWGTHRVAYGSAEEGPRVDYQTNPELARYIARGLVKKGFDLANLVTLVPRGSTGNKGLGHMITGLVPMVDPDYQIPIIPLYINEYFAHHNDYYLPLPTAERCYNLGVALAEVLSDRPERIAIYASGGLSHPASGGVPRTTEGGLPNNLPLGYVDEFLDRWFLDCIERNDSDAMKKLFIVDSESVRAGSGELRAWITVAGAMGRPAKVLDYMAHWHQVCGLGYAYWPPD